MVPGKGDVRQGGIIVPERYQANSLARITRVGPECRKPIEPGAVVITPIKFAEKTNHVIDKMTGEFVCDQKHIFAYVNLDRQVIVPTGKRILINRDVDERQEKGIVVVPAAHKSSDQSLEGTVERFGIDHNKTIKGISIGDRIRLAQWEAHMIECGLNGKFCLIVNEDDIIAVLK